jgi:hypothetical protein
MRVTPKANVVIEDGTNNKNKLFAPDDELSLTVLDGLQECSSGQENMLTAAVFAVPFGGLTDVRGFFLESTGDFNLTINGGASIQVRRGVIGADGAVATSCRCLMEAQVTALEITAVSDSNVTWALWGKPLA